MNPIRWIRWKVLLALMVLSAGFLTFGLDPLARTQLNSLGAGQLGARWNVDGLSISLAHGSIQAHGFSFAVPQELNRASRDRVISAKAITFDIDMSHALRRRFYGEMHLQAPSFTLERQADGTINIGKIGKRSRTGPESHRPQDWVEAIESWAEKLRQIEKWNIEQWKKRIEEQMGQKDGAETPEATPPELDYAKRITYPFEGVNRFVVTRVVGDGLTIAFQDDSETGQPIPPLVDGRIEIENLSDNPHCYAEPIRWAVTGQLAGAPVRIVGQIDLRLDATNPDNPGSSYIVMRAEADGVPAQLANAFAGKSLPMNFDAGTLRLFSEITISDLQNIEIRPQFAFHDAVVSPKPNVPRIAGFRAGEFCKAFNEVRTFELEDVFVTGTFAQPKIHLGDTLKDLVVSGGKALAQRKMDEELDKGAEKVKELLKQELGDSDASRLLDGLPIDIDKGVEQTKKKASERLRRFLR